MEKEKLPNNQLSVITTAQESGPKQPSKGTSRKPSVKGIFLIVLVVLIVVGAFCYGTHTIANTYRAVEESVYNGFYQTAFNVSERRNHVSNYAVISVEGIQTVARLEVLTVNDSEFVIKHENNTVSWLEVQGTGVFTVDLAAGEFIVDPERNYVLVRVPRPTLTECKVSTTGKQFLKVNNGNFFFNGSVGDGVRLSQEQLSEGRIMLEDSMRQSRAFNEAAKDSTIRMIEALVLQWNPNIPGLTVKVEFMESG